MPHSVQGRVVFSKYFQNNGMTESLTLASRCKDSDLLARLTLPPLISLPSCLDVLRGATPDAAGVLPVVQAFWERDSQDFCFWDTPLPWQWLCWVPNPCLVGSMCFRGLLYSAFLGKWGMGRAGQYDMGKDKEVVGAKWWKGPMVRGLRTGRRGIGEGLQTANQAEHSCSVTSEMTSYTNKNIGALLL